MAGYSAAFGGGLKKIVYIGKLLFDTECDLTEDLLYGQPPTSKSKGHFVTHDTHFNAIF